MEINDNKSCNELSLRRDSFSDRFCDDLCEVIVSYLSFEDKIRFECVSHQFQRLLFNKQYVLRVFDFIRLGTHNSLNQLLVIKETTNHYKVKQIDLKAFESVLKKCKFINKIDIMYGIVCENREKVLQLIIKYVKHLKSIEFDFKDINEKVLLEFAEKCGQKLQNINFRNKVFDNKYNDLLKLCPNIRSLTNIRLEDMIEDNVLLVPKLMSIKGLFINSDNNLFETFVNETENSLKCLGIYFESDYMNENFVLKFLVNISRFVNLEELYLQFYQYFRGIKSFGDSLHSIGINCKKIKILSFNLYDDYCKDQDLSFLLTFTQLKKLSLIYFRSNLVIKSLQNCKQLTHLRINPFELNDTFKDIHLYLPQLTHLYCRISSDSNLTDSQIRPLAKLKQLKCLKLSFFNRISWSFADDCICEIINNCPEIKSILFDENPKITDKTINALISLAEKKPFCRFVHSFGRKPDKSEEDFDYLQFLTNKKYENLPKNLNITPYDYPISFYS